METNILHQFRLRCRSLGPEQRYHIMKVKQAFQVIKCRIVDSINLQKGKKKMDHEEFKCLNKTGLIPQSF